MYSNIASRVPELIEDASNELPGAFRVLVQRLLDHLKELDRQVDELEVTAEGTFEYEGKFFKSLSAVARHISGTPWSGPLFFGLKTNSKEVA